MTGHRWAREFVAVAALGAGILGCQSAPGNPGAEVTFEKGNIVVRNLPAALRCVQVTVQREGLPDLQVPDPTKPGLPMLNAEDGTVTIPTTQSQTPIRVTAIRIVVPEDCAPALAGTYEYTGQPFELSRTNNHVIRWGEFKN